jgi:hypothetical protein
VPRHFAPSRDTRKASEGWTATRPAFFGSAKESLIDFDLAMKWFTVGGDQRRGAVEKRVRAQFFRGEESLKLHQRLWSRLVGERILRLHVIGQRCRIVMWDLIEGQGHLRYRR